MSSPGFLCCDASTEGVGFRELRFKMLNLSVFFSNSQGLHVRSELSNHFVLQRNLRTHRFDFRFQSCESSHRYTPVKLRVLISDSPAEIFPYLNRINCLYQRFRPDSVVESDLRKVLETP